MNTEQRREALEVDIGRGSGKTGKGAIVGVLGFAVKGALELAVESASEFGVALGPGSNLGVVVWALGVAAEFMMLGGAGWALPVGVGHKGLRAFAAWFAAHVDQIKPNVASPHEHS